MPLLPASLIEPLGVEFAALIGAEDRPEFSPTHPWGCQRRRVPDRVVFEHVIAAWYTAAAMNAWLMALAEIPQSCSSKFPVADQGAGAVGRPVVPG